MVTKCGGKMWWQHMVTKYEENMRQTVVGKWWRQNGRKCEQNVVAKCGGNTW